MIFRLCTRDDSTCFISKAIPVGILKIGICPDFINRSIAVVVNLVTILDSIWIDLLILIIAIICIVYELSNITCTITTEDFTIGIAKAILICIKVIDTANAIVDIIITIVIQPIADFFHTRMNIGICIITVIVVGYAIDTLFTTFFGYGWISKTVFISIEVKC